MQGPLRDKASPVRRGGSSESSHLGMMHGGEEDTSRRHGKEIPTWKTVSNGGDIPKLSRFMLLAACVCHDYWAWIRRYR